MNEDTKATAKEINNIADRMSETGREIFLAYARGFEAGCKIGQGEKGA